MYSRGLLLLAAALAPALANDVFQPGTPEVDRPTLTALGIKLPISGDDNYNASVTTRYRRAGDETWREALPLYRVEPDTVVAWNVSPGFAGSIFDLRPPPPQQLRPESESRFVTSCYV